LGEITAHEASELVRDCEPEANRTGMGVIPIGTRVGLGDSLAVVLRHTISVVKHPQNRKIIPPSQLDPDRIAAVPLGVAHKIPNDLAHSVRINDSLH
jgi:hypothetical protein